MQCLDILKQQKNYTLQQYPLTPIKMINQNSSKMTLGPSGAAMYVLLGSATNYGLNCMTHGNM
jgi:hypothetical protein